MQSRSWVHGMERLFLSALGPSDDTPVFSLQNIGLFVVIFVSYYISGKFGQRFSPPNPTQRHSGLPRGSHTRPSS